jgi:hypothetical protein
MKIIAKKWGGHATYYVDGEKWPGPSGLMPDDKQFLTGWALKEARAFLEANFASMPPTSVEAGEWLAVGARQRTDWPAQRGTRCHALMEALMTGREVVETDPSIRADAEAAVRLADSLDLRPVATEIALANVNEWYAGTADLIAESDRLGGRALLDYKFTSAIRSSYPIQLSAYVHATHRIVEVEKRGPRGGKQGSEWHLETWEPPRQDVAFLVHVKDGQARLQRVTIDGEVWAAVQLAAEVYWSWSRRNVVAEYVEEVAL